MGTFNLSEEMAFKLLGEARNAKSGSYAPYSKFRVGAAVLLDSGDIVCGANIENASYGLTCCAERTALYTAMFRAAGDKKRLCALAVSCGDTRDLPESSLVPCGACRQVMMELLGPQTPVIMDGLHTTTVSELLPKPFLLSNID